MAGTSITLRGRCRCGEVLSFTLTPAGYKRVCPRCRSVVRLNPKQREKKRPRGSGARSAAPAPGAATLRCSCGEPIQVPAGNAAPLVVCPACQQAVPIPEGSTPHREHKTVELSENELAELARELSTAVVDAGEGVGSGVSAGGWEQGLRACQACGELLGLGSTVCRHCGTANAG
jgi:hypothetical protein